MEAVNKLQAYNKAIAAMVVGIIAILVTQFNFNITPEVQAGLVTVVTAFIVWLVPNR